MELLVFLITIFFLLTLVKLSVRIVEHHNPIIKERVITGYKKKFRVMTRSESILFYELRKQLVGYYIFPNMRLADVVNPVEDFKFRHRLYKILPKHLDFTICNSNFEPLLAIELNGSSHNKWGRMKSDNFKKEVLEEADLSFRVIYVGDNFVEQVAEVKAYLSSL